MTIPQLRETLVEMLRYSAEERNQCHRSGHSWEKWNGKWSAYQQVISIIDDDARAADCTDAFKPLTIAATTDALSMDAVDALRHPFGTP